MRINAISFKGIPSNYSKIDNTLSRSAQPMADDFAWLKEQGITDIVNFRTMVVSGVEFDEKTAVESLGMKYHNIPSITSKPEEKNVKEFLNLAKNVADKKGKLHIHCKAGADRTGMYAFIYKAMQNIGNLVENEKEWIAKGHNIQRYPDLRVWTKELVNKLKQVK